MWALHCELGMARKVSACQGTLKIALCGASYIYDVCNLDLPRQAKHVI